MSVGNDGFAAVAVIRSSSFNAYYRPGAAPPSRLGDTSHGFRRARLSIAACEVRGGTADISGECDAERAG